MGMNIGSSSDGEVISDINTTPLIDVMLVLLIMLIITIPIQLHAVNLTMPDGSPPPAVQPPPEVVRLAVTADGGATWDGEAVADAAALDRRLQALAARAEPPEIHLRPERDAPYRRVAEVMAAVQRAGLTKIGLVGGEQFR